MPAKVYSEIDEKLKAKHEKEPEGLFEQAKETLESVFVSSIPYEPIQDYPRHHMCTFGAMSLFFVFLFCGGVFAYLFVSNVKTQFLTTSSDDAGGAICETIMASNTGKFLGTRDGHWEGSEGFSYIDASFSFDVANLQVSEQEYKKSMKGLFEEFDSIGVNATQNNLAQNLLYWMAYTTMFQEDNRVTFTGDPGAAFDRDLLTGAISSVRGQCYDISFDTSFDPVSRRMTLSLDGKDLLKGNSSSTDDDAAAAGVTAGSSNSYGIVRTMNFDVHQKKVGRVGDRMSSLLRAKTTARRQRKRRQLSQEFEPYEESPAATTVTTSTTSEFSSASAPVPAASTVSPMFSLQETPYDPNVFSCNQVAGGNYLLDNNLTFGKSTAVNFNIDTRSLVVAVSVNEGILDIDTLISVPQLAHYLGVFNGEEMYADAYYDPRCKSPSLLPSLSPLFFSEILLTPCLFLRYRDGSDLLLQRHSLHDQGDASGDDSLLQSFR